MTQSLSQFSFAVLLASGWIGIASPMAGAQEEGEERPVETTDLKGSERIWGFILHATTAAGKDEDEGNPSEQKADKKFREAAVKDVLGKVGKALPQFNAFAILGAHDQKVLREYATWITPSTDFFLAIDSKGRAKEGDGINIYLQLWGKRLDPDKQDKVLVKSDAVLKRGSPLIIEGPKWREGRVIFVIMLEYLELFDKA